MQIANLTSPGRLPLVGLIGGMGWESSSLYYRVLNEKIRARLGGVRSARTILYSFDFGELEPLVSAELWGDLTALMVKAATDLERQGVDLIAICSNTSHIAAAPVCWAISKPLIHIADPTGHAANARGLTTVGVLGTRPVLEMDFMLERWRDVSGLTVLVPPSSSRERLHQIIYTQLLSGHCSENSRMELHNMALDLKVRGADAIVLACTDLSPWLDGGADFPCLDTALLHAEAIGEAGCVAKDVDRGLITPAGDLLYRER